MTAAYAAPSLHPIESALLRAVADGLRANIGRWIRFAGHRAGDVLEMQAIDVRSNRWTQSLYAHAKTLDEALKHAQAAAAFECAGIYVIANLPNPSLRHSSPRPSYLSIARIAQLSSSM